MCKSKQEIDVWDFGLQAAILEMGWELEDAFQNACMVLDDTFCLELSRPLGQNCNNDRKICFWPTKTNFQLVTAASRAEICVLCPNECILASAFLKDEDRGHTFLQRWS